MIELKQTADGVLLPVKALPRSKQTAVRGLHAGRLKIAVAAPPEAGRANHAIRALLANILHLAASQIELHAGATARDKVWLLRGISPDQINARLQASQAIQE